MFNCDFQNRDFKTALLKKRTFFKQLTQTQTHPHSSIMFLVFHYLLILFSSSFPNSLFDPQENLTK
jgi:hypothetical protein